MSVILERALPLLVFLCVCAVNSRNAAFERQRNLRGHKFFDNREYDDGYDEFTAAEKKRMLTLRELLLEEQEKQLEDESFADIVRQRSNLIKSRDEGKFEKGETDREFDGELRTEGTEFQASKVAADTEALSPDDLALKREEEKMKKKETEQENQDYPAVGELFEGDIVMDTRLRDWVTGSMNKRDAVVLDDVKWPKGELPYVIADDIPRGTLKRHNIEQAIRDFHDYTCIRLREKEDEDKDYVRFIGSKKNQCYSSVGRAGGAQEISIGDGCERLGTVQHEILHALGFIHEQSRPDRDDYVKVVKENIKPEMIRNFDKYPRYMVSDMDVGYDFDSVLHYNNRAFSLNGEDTLIDLANPQRKFGQREMFSKRDVEQLNKLYDCPMNDELEEKISRLKYY